MNRQTKKVIVGLDLSFEATGLAILEINRDFSMKSHKTFSFGTSKKLETDQRRFRYECIAQEITDRVFPVLQQYFIDDLEVLIASEHYIMAGRGRICHMAELAGFVKGHLLRGFLDSEIVAYEHQWAEVPPGTLKKYATGSGKAYKEDMMKAASRKFRIDFQDDNECDAFWLADFMKTLASPYTSDKVKQHLNSKVNWF